MERGIYKKFEKMLKEKGYKIEKELENRLGHEYIFYAVKNEIKIEIRYKTKISWLINEINRKEFLNEAIKKCNEYKFNVDYEVKFFDDIKLHTVYYAYKDENKIYLCDICDENNKFTSINMNEIENKLKECLQ